MKTKLLTLSAIFILSTLALQAQVDFGFLAGINLQNINGKDSDGDKLENGLTTGFHAGVNLNILLTTDFYFQPGVLFSVKGARNDFYLPSGEVAGNLSTTTKLSYIEIPLNVLYRPLLGNGHILFGFGPYIAYGIIGKETSDFGNVSYERPVIFKNTVVDETDLEENAYYKAFDAGGNIFFGYEIAMGIFLQLNVQLGMLKINSDKEWTSNDESAYRNTGYGLSLGYRF